MKLKQNAKSFKLCGRKGCGGCPEVSFDNQNAYINDDYGNRVQMTIDEFLDIVRNQSEFLEENDEFFDDGMISPDNPVTFIDGEFIEFEDREVFPFGEHLETEEEDECGNGCFRCVTIDCGCNCSCEKTKPDYD